MSGQRQVRQKANDNLNASGDNLDSTCVVCFKNVEIYSIGECDHPVCYECSTRMRVLCQQNECPICRQGLSKVNYKQSGNDSAQIMRFPCTFYFGYDSAESPSRSAAVEPNNVANG